MYKIQEWFYAYVAKYEQDILTFLLFFNNQIRTIMSVSNDKKHSTHFLVNMINILL